LTLILHLSSASSSRANATFVVLKSILMSQKAPQLVQAKEVRVTALRTVAVISVHRIPAGIVQYDAEFGVLTVVLLKIQVSWYVTPCRMVNGH
jgi:hypothetical protein